jgi:hypothetical protein
MISTSNAKEALAELTDPLRIDAESPRLAITAYAAVAKDC